MPTPRRFFERWKRQLHKYGERSFGGRGYAYTEEARIVQLERTLGQMAAENALIRCTGMARTL
jgi:hypothetical protein